MRPPPGLCFTFPFIATKSLQGGKGAFLWAILYILWQKMTANLDNPKLRPISPLLQKKNPFRVKSPDLTWNNNQKPTTTPSTKNQQHLHHKPLVISASCIQAFSNSCRKLFENIGAVDLNEATSRVFFQIFGFTKRMMKVGNSERSIHFFLSLGASNPSNPPKGDTQKNHQLQRREMKVANRWIGSRCGSLKKSMSLSWIVSEGSWAWCGMLFGSSSQNGMENGLVMKQLCHENSPFSCNVGSSCQISLG